MAGPVTESVYYLPTTVWRRLRHHRTLSYRVITSRITDGWRDSRSSIADRQWHLAPSIQLFGPPGGTGPAG
jgi:hypothetical protein